MKASELELERRIARLEDAVFAKKAEPKPAEKKGKTSQKRPATVKDDEA